MERLMPALLVLTMCVSLPGFGWGKSVAWVCTSNGMTGIYEAHGYLRRGMVFSNNMSLGWTALPGLTNLELPSN